MKPRSSRLIPSTGKLLATVPVIVCASQAQGQIVYTDLGTGVTAPSIFFNVDGSLVSTSAPGSYQFNALQKGTLTLLSTSNTITPAVYAYPGGLSTTATVFSSGDLIDFDPIANGAADPSVNAPGPTYLGLAVNVAGQWDYGWAQVQGSSGPNLTLYGFAYDPTGAPIHAGQTAVVPEPDSTTALAGLVAGSVAAFAALRKRKAAAAA